MSLLASVVLGLVVLAASSSTTNDQVEKPAEQAFTLLGTVYMSKAALPKDMPVVPVTFDARFVIRVRIDSIIAGEAPWKEGTTVAFLIHSPSRMFRRYDVNGEQFRFTFATEQGSVADRDCRYCITALARVERTKE